MSAYLYDESLINKLREITGDQRIHIIAPDQAISFLAQFDKDKVDLPAIVLTRGPISLNSTKNQFAYLKGQTVRVSTDNTATKLKVVPMRINWSIDVYAVDRYTCDEIVRELVYFFLTQPRFEVKVPYGADYPQNFDVFLEDEIADNSDLVEFPNTGELFRETLSIYTDNAHMFASRRQYLTQVTYDGDEKDMIIKKKENNL